MYTSIAAYHFVPVSDPVALAAQVRQWATAAGLLGTVLVAEEGINLFLAGARRATDAFLGQLRADPRFARLRVKYGTSSQPPFARLKVKVKHAIIAFRPTSAECRQPSAALAAPVPTVRPVDLARWIAQGADDAGRPLVLLDTRNREEVGHGSFAGARSLPIDNFSEFAGAVAADRDALEGATVVGFCTGGIRCEKAMPWMRDAGFANVYQLDGGILGYFEDVGGLGFEGNCFVFDARVAVDPALRPAFEVGDAGRRAAA